jgi:phosphoglycolate phosphatase
VRKCSTSRWATTSRPSSRRSRSGSVPKPLAVLFDIDGTLISSGGATTRSWKGAFAELYGVEADIGKFTTGGMTDPNVGRATFVGVLGREPTDDEMAKLMAAYVERVPHEVETSPGYKVLDGVVECLEALRDEGVLLGLTSGGLEVVAHAKLARADLNRFFTFGGYGSDSADRAELTRRGIERASEILKHELSAAEVDVVGDTPLDITAAHAASATAVGVASGAYSADQLREAGADHVLGSLAEPFPL